MPLDGKIVLGPDVVALLQDLGLTWDEVQIYQFLLNASTAIASAVAREADQSRGRIYESLRAMVDKGYVREIPTDPIEFEPTPLAEILERAEDRLTDQLEAVEAGKATALRSSNGDAALPLVRPTRSRDVSVYSGRYSCNDVWERMLEEATSFFWLTGGGNLAHRLAGRGDFLESLGEVGQGPVDVQLVLPQDVASVPALEEIRDVVGPDVLQVAMVDQFGPLASCATDKASMETIAQPDDKAPSHGDDVGIQVASSLFARATKERFELAQAFILGEGSVPLYEWLSPDRGSQVLVEAVQEAEKEVRVMGPPDWTGYLAADWEQASKAHEQARGRGVNLRALTDRPEAKESMPPALASVWDVRVTDEHPIWLTLVDDRELYQAFGPPVPGARPQLRQSREPNEVQFYATVFDRLWERAEPV